MCIKGDEEEFKSTLPKLHAFVQAEAKLSGVDISDFDFKIATIMDEEYAEVIYTKRGSTDYFEVLAHGSEDGSFGEWSLESCALMLA